MKTKHIGQQIKEISQKELKQKNELSNQNILDICIETICSHHRHIIITAAINKTIINDVLKYALIDNYLVRQRETKIVNVPGKNEDNKKKHNSNRNKLVQNEKTKKL